MAHAGAPLALHAAGARLYDGWTGFWAAALYSLMPGVQLSAGLMTTDAPMLLFLSLALWAYAAWLRAEPGRGATLAAASLGAALGLAALSKYAALYFLAGLLLHAVVSPSTRRRWRLPSLAAVMAGAGLVVAPNLLWNADHGFATVAHTADNAQWSGAALFNPGELANFLFAQLGVFGILPLLALATGLLVVAVRPSARRGLPPADWTLLCLTLPPLLIVAGQAFISRANANWAVAAYVPGAVLLAAWLVRRARAAPGRWSWPRWVLAGTALSQGVVALLFTAVVISPAVASAVGLDNALKRARGWRATTEAVTAQALAGRWSAVSTDDRFLFNAMAYYGRDVWDRPGAPPLRMWVRESEPQNQAETEAPLLPSQSMRVLHASLNPDYQAEAARDFRTWRPLKIVSVPLDRKRTRETALFEAGGWARAPRDPLTGRPYARPTAP
jgi:4-amino-4-deoxy-L-arabinose transferase-like glycosyltransferase